MARVRATRTQHQHLARAFIGARWRTIPLYCTTAYISTANRTWASIEPWHMRRPCLIDGLGDGIVILHVEHHHWRIVTEGSAFRCPIVSDPRQPRVPAGVASDLVRYVHCAARRIDA